MEFGYKNSMTAICFLLHSLLLWRQQTTMLRVAYGEVRLVKGVSGPDQQGQKAYK